MPARNHPLLQRYSLTNSITLSTGSAPMPYLIYDGVGVLIGGTLPYATASAWTQGEDLHPIRTADGNALMAIWLMNFTDASLGAHHELQYSLFVAREPGVVVPSGTFALIDLMAFEPRVRMLCHGLWNNTPVVVAYNSELLGLDARLCASSISADGGKFRFAVSDAANGQALVRGELDQPARPTPAMLMALMRAFGWRKLSALARMPYAHMQVVNRKNPRLPVNTEAQAYNAADQQIVRAFVPGRDTLTIEHPLYATSGFVPQFVEHITGITFVYLNPHNRAGG